MLKRQSHKQPSDRWWLWLVLVWVSCGTLCSAQEVTLHMRNGDRITGAIVTESAEQLTISTSFAGRITIRTSDIERRESLPPSVLAKPPAEPAAKPQQTPPVTPPPPAGVLPSPARPPEKPKAAADNKAAEAGQAASENATALADFRKFLLQWRGELQLGLNLGYSTKDRQTYTGRFKAGHTRDSLKNTLNYDVRYGRIEGVLSDNQMDGGWRIEHDLGADHRFHIYNVAGAGYDEIQKIDLRYDVGPGVGYKWLSLSNLVLKTELGADYQHLVYIDNPDKTRYALRLAEDLTWALSSKLKFDEKIEFFPQIDAFGEYRFRMEGNLSYLVRNNLTLNLSLIDLYDTATPEGVSKNDLQIRSSIGIKF